MRKAQAAIAAFLVFVAGLELGCRLQRRGMQKDNYIIPRTHPAAESARRKLQSIDDRRAKARNN